MDIECEVTSNELEELINTAEASIQDMLDACTVTAPLNDGEAGEIDAPSTHDVNRAARDLVYKHLEILSIGNNTRR